MKIDGKTFVVTGAGSGLGEATSHALAGRGAAVVCVDVDRDAANATAAAVGGTSAMADVRSEAEVAAVFEATAGRLGGVVSCAGIAHGERTVGRQGPHDLAAFEKVVSVNLIGAFNVARTAAAVLASQPPDGHGRRGVIVNTASVAAFDGQVGQAAYAASKGGVAAMTLPLARDLARLGVRCITIAPGIFDTPMLRSLSEDARASLGAQVPFPSRLGDPAEFAALVIHVVENDMLNGEVIRLDGALRMAAT